MAKDNLLSSVAKASAVFIVYFVTAKIGLSFDAVSGFATLVWPPTGIALAVMILMGYRYWPAITLAAFLVNRLTGAPLFVAGGIAIGNTLEAVIGAYLLRRFVNFQPALKRVKDVVGLILFAAVFSTAVSATIGVSSLLLGKVIISAAYLKTWIAWWLGDMLGSLVIAPLLLVWSKSPRSIWYQRAKIVSSALPFILLILVGIFIFQAFSGIGGQLALLYPIYPVLIWIALRLGPRGSVTATFIVSIIAVASTIAGYGPFASQQLSYGLLLLQSFIAITAVTFMTMAAVVAEREYTQKIRQSLAQRNLVLAKQRSRLMEINEAKDDFISAASHQLRTPATIVKQYIGLMLEGYSGELTKDQSAFATRAYENNERQIKTINSLLEVARLDTGKLKLTKTKVNVAAFLAEFVRQLSKDFVFKNQTLVLTSKLKRVDAEIDKDMLGMALENIIDNASKYSPEDEKITIDLTQDNKQLYISISDRGIGISKKDQKKLFQKFSRISNPRSTPVGGSGIGLYLAKQIISLYHGNIDVKSAAGKGSTFTIALPNSDSSLTKGGANG